MSARILIIEDDPPSLELLRYLLEAAGHTTLCATDGGAGVRMALDEQPDLVLCDLQMPVMSGYQVAQSLREYLAWRQVPIIAVTAFSMPGDREKTLACGFNEHISKPISPALFVGQVESLLPPALHGTAPRPD